MAARNLRTVLLWPQQVVLFRIKPKHLAKSSTSRTTRTPRGGGLADPAYLQCRKTCPRRVRCDSRKAAVDDGGHAFDRDRTLSHVRRQDQLSCQTRHHCLVLFGGREIAVERQQKQPCTSRGGLALTHGLPYLRDARQKREHMARVLLSQQKFDCLPHLHLQRLRRVRHVADRERKHAAFRTEHRTIAKEAGDRRSVERRRHHDDA